MNKRVLVVGGGPGGYVAAIRASQLGADVTLAEREKLGGTCLNVGCIPTKSLLHTAGLLSELRERGPELGILADNLRLDFHAAMAHKAAAVRQLSEGVGGLLRANGVKILRGSAFFTAPGQMELQRPDGTAEPLEADAIILAPGSVNALPPIPGLAGNPHCLDSTGILALEKPPESLIVIGGGVVGLEMACVYSAFGARVTVLEARDRMLPMLDGEIAALGIRHMAREGVRFHLNCAVRSVEALPSGVRVICGEKGERETVFEAETLLTAAGRRPNTAALRPERGGIETERGYIRVNSRMETNVPGVYAVGDCVPGRAQLAHAASAMGETAAENAVGRSSVYDERACPSCVYIRPEAASVGLTEEQCRERSLDYTAGVFPMAANGKALIENGGEGAVKVLADRESGKLLGVHIIGPRASDLISEAALAINLGAGLGDLIRTVHPHPTVSEALREAALDAQGRAVHLPPRRRRGGPAR